MNTRERANTFWGQEQVGYLEELHKAGVSFAEMARRMTERFGMEYTKNMVLGKARRLGLPIRVVREAPPRRPPRRPFDFAGPACVWPIGHPTDADFRLCGDMPYGSKPYCAKHAALAYVKPKELPDELSREEFALVKNAQARF